MNAAGRRIKKWPQPLAILLATSSFVRCNHRAHGRACDARRTLAKPLERYVRPPRCKVCGRRKYRVDLSRTLERGRFRKRPCRCCEYPFPHRLGSGLCLHNPTKPTPEQRQEMHEAFAASWRDRRR
jgi:hypothetical protein